MNRKDIDLLSEAYDDVLTSEKFNWKGALGAAVMATSPIVTSCSREVNTQAEPQIKQTVSQSPSSDQCSLLFKDKESIVDTIINKDVIVRVKKSDYLKAVYGERGAKKYLSAMPQSVRDATVHVYSIAASKKAGVQVSGKVLATYNLKTNSIHFNDDYPKKTDFKSNLIQSLTHEISHSTDNVRFGKEFLFKKAAKENRVFPFSKSVDYHLRLTEIRARVAASREYLEPIANEQDFMQKWNHVVSLLKYYKGDFKKFYSNNKEIPTQFKDLVYVYAKMLPKQHKNAQEEFLNYIIKSALDYSVAKSNQSTTKHYA